jgi:DNA-binding Xre family transcriptional regulator
VCVYGTFDKGYDTLYKGEVKTLKSNMLVLAALKSQRENRRVSLRKIAEETGIQKYTVYGFANNTLREYPKEAIEKLCSYFECEIGDLLILEESTTA